MLKQKNILIAGGDKRYLAVIDTFMKHGATVYLAGFDQLSIEENHVIQAKLEQIPFSKLDAILLPVSGTDGDGHIESTYSDSTLHLTESLLQQTPEHCIIYTGISNTYLDTIAANINRKVIPIFKRDDIAILNSIPTAEGTLKIAIEETDHTIHGANVIVLGFGRVGVTVSRTFQQIGANVTVACRNETDIARIQEMRMKPLHLRKLKSTIGNEHIIINTIPHLILHEDILHEVDRAALIIDLASRPGGVDFETAKQLGIKAIHALGIPGKIAPRTAGEIIAQVLMELIEENA